MSNLKPITIPWTDTWIMLTYSLALGGFCFLGGCGPAHTRDTMWKNYFKEINYVSQQLTPLDGKAAKDTKSVLFHPDQVNETGKRDINWIKDYDDARNATNPNENLVRIKRNRVINGYLLLADSAYAKFESGYNDAIAEFEIGADLVNLGLTSASAVTGPAALLGAAATGGLGVQHSIEKNALNSQTRFVITNRMNAIREQKRTEIMKRELKPDCLSTTLTGDATGQQSASISDVCYTLGNGMVDVQEYFNLGSIHRALASIDTETQKINQPAAANAPTFLNANTVTFTVGIPLTFAVKTSGSPAPTLTQTGESLPQGLVFDPATGILKWTATQGTAKTYNIIFTATNTQGSAEQKFTIVVVTPPAIPNP